MNRLNAATADAYFSHTTGRCNSLPCIIYYAIDLSRNFGHHQAGMVGLGQASGEYVFLIDCDLEEAPELLATF